MKTWDVIMELLSIARIVSSFVFTELSSWKLGRSSSHFLYLPDVSCRLIVIKT